MKTVSVVSAADAAAIVLLSGVEPAAWASLPRGKTNAALFPDTPEVRAAIDRWLATRDRMAANMGVK